jgi:hypothetical protein
VFSSIGGIFAGFLEGGGDASPGKAYIVGERRPELFVPKQAGRVMPSVAMADGGTHVTHIEQHIHGVRDFDSFRRSQSQIYADLQHVSAVAHARNR